MRNRRSACKERHVWVEVASSAPATPAVSACCSSVLDVLVVQTAEEHVHSLPVGSLGIGVDVVSYTILFYSVANGCGTV